MDGARQGRIVEAVGVADAAVRRQLEVLAAEAVGPILLGTKKPVHVLQLDCSIREVVNMATIAVIDAQISNH